MQNKAKKKFHMIPSTLWRTGPKFLNDIGRSGILMVAKWTGRLWGDTYLADSENKASLTSSETVLGLPTGT